jgi:hypothetical protein
LPWGLIPLIDLIHQAGGAVCPLGLAVEFDHSCELGSGHGSSPCLMVGIVIHHVLHVKVWKDDKILLPAASPWLGAVGRSWGGIILPLDFWRILLYYLSASDQGAPLTLAGA